MMDELSVEYYRDREGVVHEVPSSIGRVSMIGGTSGAPRVSQKETRIRQSFAGKWRGTPWPKAFPGAHSFRGTPLI